MITLNDQEKAMIAMLRGFESRREDEANSEIAVIKRADAWEVHLCLNGGFESNGSGGTFSAAWDDMIKSGGLAAIQSEIIGTLTSVSAHESELIMGLRRRAATGDDYIIFLAVNGEDHRGEWAVIEEKVTRGSGLSFSSAWDERF